MDADLSDDLSDLDEPLPNPLPLSLEFESTPWAVSLLHTSTRTRIVRQASSVSTDLIESLNINRLVLTIDLLHNNNKFNLKKLLLLRLLKKPKRPKMRPKKRTLKTQQQ
eukprot:GABV01012344.1.p1 GENE.GABV01012344.1~~GABV01012344.1.p1  ORF type:complete len:109 (+),score=41.68 GABV01012344.1:39-365(+)